MKNAVVSILFICFGLSVNAANASKFVLWYDAPAKNWNEALPIGNGSLGAMVFGYPEQERLQLNEATLWTGGPAELNPNPDAPNYLGDVRALLFAGKNDEASRMLRKMQGPNTQMYQPLGDLIIYQKSLSPASAYYRDLNIETAIATTRFTQNDVELTREIFSSAPDSVMVLHLKANRKGALNLALGVSHPLAFTSEKQGSDLVLKGKARIESDENRNQKPILFDDVIGDKGMFFQFRVRVISCDGKVEVSDSLVEISDATDAVVLVSAATSYNGFRSSPTLAGKDQQATALRRLDAAQGKSYETLKAAHIADYQKYFKRVELNLSTSEVPDLPTDKRLAAYKQGIADPHLEELYFQFGRYLLISCSRPGGIAANLQGIWCEAIRPSWRSNYTTNINLQMNYWPALPLNMTEMYEPLLRQIEHMAFNGRFTAKNYYHAKGWAAHHNSDIWAQTNPVGEGGGDPKWANWALGSPWLSQHLFEYYRFTMDEDFLRDRAYPIMKGAADFCIDWLVEKDGHLVTAPSTSPENVYLDKDGKKIAVTIASTMDMEIIWDLFTNVMEASKILGIDKEYAALLKSKRDSLQPIKVGKKGNVVEWYEDFEDVEPEHRHVSHLFGLHPGREISPLIDTVLSNAARRTLELRGDGGTGWSKAWKINFWARLLDGDHAYKMYQELLKTSTQNNLFDTHPPFQIDGNFGSIAGVSEFFVQSHLNEIQLLPALPKAWKDGSIKGFKARGAFEISLTWRNSKLLTGEIRSEKGTTCVLRTKEPVKIYNAKCKVKKVMLQGVANYIYTFPTVAGYIYGIKSKTNEKDNPTSGYLPPVNYRTN